jgi:hypothetical protein
MLPPRPAHLLDVVVPILGQERVDAPLDGAQHKQPLLRLDASARAAAALLP